MIDIMENRKTARPEDGGRKTIQKKRGEREKESKREWRKLDGYLEEACRV